MNCLAAARVRRRPGLRAEQVNSRHAFGSVSVLFGLALLLAGCSPLSLVAPAYHELRGAKAELLFDELPAASVLRAAQSVKFAPARTALGARLYPTELVSVYDREGRKAEEELRASYPGGSPVVTVDSEILYCQEKGLMSGALLLIRLTFQGEGGPIGTGLARAESKSFREGSEAALARETFKVLREFFEKPRKPPKHEKE